MNTTDTDDTNKHTVSRGLSTELHNDRTHDSTVDTDGKNREAARLDGHGAIGPDEVTQSNATLDNSVPEARDGMAGFDSRTGDNHLLLAVTPGYTVIDRGMVEPEPPQAFDEGFDNPDLPPGYETRGHKHYALNHRRPARLIEFQRVK
ncbi:DUF3005 domain-containing protein [Paraburkholderia acidicola]|uniref:DUF3005 domain-containing protein n=1 Tax=Paraburkholderia acidicola TaxID=1912599 RepID=A0ABV1LWL5_9BURK